MPSNLRMKKIAVAITGASGSIYAQTLLNRLMEIRDQWSALDLVMSDNARQVWETEMGNRSFESYPLRFFHTQDFMAPFASGSAGYDSLIVVPCSMGMLGRVASGISNDLVTRAADVMLKERRKLILVVRDTPYNLVHIRNMETVTLAGGIICPATPSFYSRPSTFEELAATVTDRVLDLAGFRINSFRWGTTADD